MSEKEPTPISEGVLLQRERVLAIRQRIEKLSEQLAVRERDLIAERNRLSMKAGDKLDEAIDEDVRLTEAIDTLREIQLDLNQLLDESFDQEEELLKKFSKLEQRIAEVGN